MTSDAFARAAEQGIRYGSRLIRISVMLGMNGVEHGGPE
jgi:hypothetical protein